VSDRLLVDLCPDGRVTVGVQRGEELPDFAGEPFELAWPRPAGRDVPPEIVCRSSAPGSSGCHGSS